MPIGKTEKPWNFCEYLERGENTSENLWEFLRIPKNSNFEGDLSMEFVGKFGNPEKDIRIYGNSLEFAKNPENLSRFHSTKNFSFNLQRTISNKTVHSS